MGMRYQEYAPQPALSHLVRCYWTVRGRTESQVAHVNRVLPDGCMDVIFDLADRAGPQALIIGTMLQARVFEHAGSMDMLGVRFVPGAAPTVLPLTASTLTDTTLDAAEVWPDVAGLLDRLSTGTDLRQRLQELEAHLMRAHKGRERAPCAVVGMAHIERARGRLSVERLCRALQVNERTLQRSFAERVGLTPKQAIRVMRFRHALRVLQQRNGTLAAVAHACGYADQAHFTREFRELAALSPRAYLRERRIVGFVQDPDAVSD